MKQLGGLYPGGNIEDFPEDLRLREFPEASGESSMMAHYIYQIPVAVLECLNDPAVPELILLMMVVVQQTGNITLLLQVE